MVIVEIKAKEEQLDKIFNMISNFNKLNDCKIEINKAYKIVDVKKTNKSGKYH